MTEQLGPKKFFEELKDQAPRYAKLLPELPHLLHKYLREQSQEMRTDYKDMLQELKRTNRLLQTLIYGGVGFALGLLLVQILLHLRNL
jgi:ubiquinone biosynthesis protein